MNQINSKMGNYGQISFDPINLRCEVEKSESQDQAWKQK